MKGEVAFYRLFVLGVSWDLDEITGTVDVPLRAGRIIEDLVPLLHDSYEVNVDPEPYTVYCVSVTETPVRVFTTAWRREVTALLANDPRPDAISDEEVEDTWRNWFSYYQDDLVVLDWDAALVIEPSASYEDTLTVFELANLSSSSCAPTMRFWTKSSTKRTTISRTSSRAARCCGADTTPSRNWRRCAWTSPRRRSRSTTSRSSGGTGSSAKSTGRARRNSSSTHGGGTWRRR